MTSPAIPPSILTSAAISRSGGQLKKKWRGCGQGMFAFANGHHGTSIISQIVRSRHVFPIPVRRFRAVYALFSVYQLSSPTRHQDCIWGSPDDTGGAGAAARSAVALQLGFEYPFVEALTGLAARPAVTFGSQNYYQYSYASWNGVPYVVSDIYDIGQTLPAGTPFGLHSGSQVAGSGGGNGQIPVNFKGMNGYVNRYEGYTISFGNIMVGKGGATNQALTDAAYTAFPSTGSGSDAGIAPSFLLVETDEDVWEQVTVVGVGDSTMRRVGEGANGPNRGDVRGSADGNGGWPERYVTERLGYPFVNLGQASDGFKYVGLHQDYAKHRIALMAVANPTHILCAYNINDLSAVPTPAAWAGSTAYVRGDIRVNGSSGYVCEKGGTSAASVGPVLKTLRERDGTCVWRYVGTTSGEDKIKTFAAAFFMRLRDAMPNVPIIQSTPTANGTSTDFCITVANQTPLSQYGDNTSAKGKLSALIRTGKFGADGYIELGLAGVENSFSLSGDVATEDSKFKVATGAAYTLTGAVSAATSATLSTAWAGETNPAWVITFSDGTNKLVTFTNGSAAVSWTGAVTATASITITQGYLMTGDLNHFNSNGCDTIAQGIRGNVFQTKRAA